MENEFIAGLDIGTTKIACLIGKRAEDGKIKILGYSCTKSIGVEHGVVRNISLTAESVKKAIEAASQQANVKVDEVYVGIAGQHIKSIPSQGIVIIPEDHKLISKDDVERLTREQNRVMLGPGDEIIHIFPQNYYVDGALLNNEIYPTINTVKSYLSVGTTLCGDCNKLYFRMVSKHRDLIEVAAVFEASCIECINGCG